MPRSPTTNVAHAAITDHRILRRPLEQPPEERNQLPKLASWREPPSAFRLRDLALGEILAGASKGLPQIEEDGARLLRGLPPEQQQDDFEVLSALEGLYLQRGDLDNAIRAGKRTVELKPQSARAAMNYGMVLERSGNLGEAERAFTRAIELNPSLKSPYAELAKLYSRQGRTGDMNSTVDRYLGWNPQDIMFRLQKQKSSRP